MELVHAVIGIAHLNIRSGSIQLNNRTSKVNLDVVPCRIATIDGIEDRAPRLHMPNSAETFMPNNSESNTTAYIEAFALGSNSNLFDLL